ncbi:hypothetical protein TNIN_320051 [Trichonephila inaurata madagascariensis]|uniref:Thyroglobulin type-1 domain-containing protein n=1 Tax=Trichonephila inaurata madagascariensis TaxID=2747483 RepID=A0A8X6X2S3_9ARAC|nr:hypothetical protein TNIN_320051 [Trichonephila inaurata madagascariensis]
MIRTGILLVVVLGVLVQIVKSDKNCTSGITPLGFMMKMKPKCNEHGKYLFMQCFEDSKFCACFSKRGFPITPPLSILKSCKCLVKKHRKRILRYARRLYTSV